MVRIILIIKEAEELLVGTSYLEECDEVCGLEERQR